MGFFQIFGFNSTNPTQNEIELINKLNFDIELITELKKETKTKIIQLPQIVNDANGRLNNLYNGVQLKTNLKKGEQIVLKLKKKFKDKGYLIFVFGVKQHNKFSIAVIKGKYELDILKFRQVCGVKYENEGDNMVANISDWDNQYGIKVIGFGIDYLNFKFDKIPDDMAAFSESVFG